MGEKRVREGIGLDFQCLNVTRSKFNKININFCTILILGLDFILILNLKCFRSLNLSRMGYGSLY